MLSIGPTSSSNVVAAQQQIGSAFGDLAEVSQKLATLQKVRRGSDDPAGLIAAEELRAELQVAEETSAAADRLRGAVHVADSGLGQTSELLAEVRGHVVAAANAGSPAEREAYQIEIDAALDAVDLIGNTTRFGGRRMLDGESLAFQYGGQSDSLDLPAVDAASLGSDQGRLADLRSGGSASVTGDLQQAMDIIDGAASEVSAGRARAGAVESYTLDAVDRIVEDQIVGMVQN
jgi:flagellin